MIVCFPVFDFLQGWKYQENLVLLLLDCIQIFVVLFVVVCTFASIFCCVFFFFKEFFLCPTEWKAHLSIQNQLFSL